jgi:hypothetical protein
MYDFVIVMLYIIYMQSKLCLSIGQYGRLFMCFVANNWAKERGTGLAHL